MEAKTYWKGITYAPRMDYVSFQANEYVFVAGGREAARRSTCRPRPSGCGRSCSSSTGSTRTWSGSAPPRSSWGRSRCSGTASASGTRSSTCSRWSPGRACTRGTSRSAASPRTSRSASTTRAAVLRHDARARRRVRGAPRPAGDLPRADEGHRAPLGRGRDRAGAVRPGAARVRRRLGHSPQRAVPRLRRGGHSTSPSTQRRRIRPLQGADERDARVGAHHPAVPRRDPGGAVDLGQPQGRAAAAARAAHLDGEPDPPLQAGDRGLPRSRRARSTWRSSRRAASSVATSSRTAARGRGA